MSEVGANLNYGSIPNLNTVSMCANCCCELNDSESSDSAKIWNRKPRAKYIFVQRDSNVPLERIPFSVILNSILLLPSRNPFTASLSICMDCANIMAHIFGSWMALENLTRSGAQLGFVRSSHAKFNGTASDRPSAVPVIVSISSLATRVGPDLISAPQLSDQDHRPSSALSPRVQSSPSLPAQIGQEHSYGKPSSFMTIVSASRIAVTRSAKLRARPPKKQKVKKPVKTYSHPPCPQCGKVFRNKIKKWMEKHIKFSHKSKSHIICDICGRPCQNNVQKATHAKIHMNQAEREACGETKKKSCCPECGKCVLSGSLWQHRKRHRNPELRRLKCKEEGCEYICSTGNGLRRHGIRIHSDKPYVTFKCVKCDESFRLYDLLKEYQMTTCEREDRPYVCIQCPRRFKVKPALHGHYFGVHKMSLRKVRNLLYPKLSRRPVQEWVGKKRLKFRDSRKQIRKPGV